MKIEKINENQIRCTLTKHDLADRELKISELAYGSDKAKSLFRDMMEQASYECGFEADDIPLMIEAVPINAECIVLTITKVEDPEELDTRFSKFAPSVHEEAFSEFDAEDITDEVMNLFQKVQDVESGLFSDHSRTEHFSYNEPPVHAKPNKPAATDNAPANSCIYSFTSLNHLIRLAHIVSDMELGENSLYKDVALGEYRLLINNDHSSAENFNKLCNIVSEYGRYLKNATGTEAYLTEHYEAVCLDHALQTLAEI
ncbi:MAG: adaptor protein MecA [Lachnospiraceae bacterium]|nr:adaptor protein MecA [Lachnospiraceae bacterium]